MATNASPVVLARLLLRLTLLLVAFLVLVTAGRGTTEIAAAAERGDVNCSGQTDSVDALQILRSVAKLPVSADCLQEAGDVDCSGELNAVDALQVLRLVAGLSVPECANPLNVTVTLDQARATSAEIPPGGGSISVTAAGGAVFTLVLPPYALADSQEITLTPVATIEGVTFSSGLIGGVQMEPSGLRLWQPATLKIEPPSPVPAGEVIPFGYLGAGNDFHLVPLTPGAGGIMLTITHFSGAGAGQGTGGDRGAIQSHTPQSPPSQLDSDLSSLDPDDPGYNEAATQAMAQYYDNTVRPQLTAAETDDSLFDSSLNTFLGWWLRNEQGFGDNPGRVADGWKSVEIAAKNAIQKAYEKCRDEHDLSRVGTLLHIGYLGEKALVPNLDLRDVQPLVEKCLRFELTLDSTIAAQHDGPQAHVKATAQLRFDDTDWTVSGSGPLNYTSFTWPQPPCSVQTSTTGSTINGKLLNLADQVAGAERPADLTLVFDPGLPLPTETTTVTCPDVPPVVFPPTTIWGGFFAVLHMDELKPEIGGPFVIQHWSILGGEVYARKPYAHSNVGATENALFELKHTPE